MPLTRSAGQKLVPVPVSDGFLEKIDAALLKAGFANRAQFIRDAIYDKLTKAGFEMHRGLAQAPSRAGKGGPRKVPSRKKTQRKK